MNARSTVETARANADLRDDGTHAARILMVSTGVLFGLILLLQAATL